MAEHLELIDWRRRVAALFAEVRARPGDAETLAWFRAEKDSLFREHPQSPIPEADRAGFGGLAYWAFDPHARVDARFIPLATAPQDETEDEDQSTAASSEISFTPIGQLEFEYGTQSLSLGAYWIAGYAGGLFVPFKDATSGHETYGGGRYLLDTIKSADLGSDLTTNRVVLDFNYAYHPSCTYDPRWVCPLAPPESRLAIAIRAGEHLA